MLSNPDGWAFVEGTLTLPGRGLVRFVLAEVQLGGGGESRMEAKKAKAKAEALAFIRRWGRCAWSTALEGTREQSAEDLACGFQRLPVPEGSRWAPGHIELFADTGHGWTPFDFASDGVIDGRLALPHQGWGLHPGRARNSGAVTDT